MIKSLIRLLMIVISITLIGCVYTTSQVHTWDEGSDSMINTTEMTYSEEMLLIKELHDDGLL